MDDFDFDDDDFPPRDEAPARQIPLGSSKKRTRASLVDPLRGSLALEDMSDICFLPAARIKIVSDHLDKTPAGRHLVALFRAAFLSATSNPIVKDLQEVIASFATMLPRGLNGHALSMLDLDRALEAACCVLSKTTLAKRSFDESASHLVDSRDPLLRITSRDWSALPTQAQADMLGVNFDVLRCYLFQMDCTATTKKTPLLRIIQR